MTSVVRISLSRTKPLNRDRHVFAVRPYPNERKYRCRRVDVGRRRWLFQPTRYPQSVGWISPWRHPTKPASHSHQKRIAVRPRPNNRQHRCRRMDVGRRRWLFQPTRNPQPAIRQNSTRFIGGYAAWIPVHPGCFLFGHWFGPARVSPAVPAVPGRRRCAPLDKSPRLNQKDCRGIAAMCPV